jgi:uncharacterized protein (DUF1697 family)
MEVMVALLRGVNVGGKNKLAMADLREITEGCGHDHVRTYIQSGNVVFRSAEESTALVAEQLQRAIADKTAVRPDVLVRSRDEFRAVLAGNPYVHRGEDPAHLHVVFTGGTSPASLESVDVASYAPEAAVAVGQQLYLFLPLGLGRSKLAAALGRLQGPSGTTRNWRTVTKLLEMADEIE